MQELKEQWLLLICTPLYIIIVLVELLLSNYRHKKIYNWKDTATNVYLMLANSLIDRYAEVTVNEIVAAARQIFRPENCSTLHYVAKN